MGSAGLHQGALRPDLWATFIHKSMDFCRENSTSLSPRRLHSSLCAQVGMSAVSMETGSHFRSSHDAKNEAHTYTHTRAHTTNTLSSSTQAAGPFSSVYQPPSTKVTTFAWRTTPRPSPDLHLEAALAASLQRGFGGFLQTEGEDLS